MGYISIGAGSLQNNFSLQFGGMTKGPLCVNFLLLLEKEKVGPLAKGEKNFL